MSPSSRSVEFVIVILLGTVAGAAAGGGVAWLAWLLLWQAFSGSPR